MGQSNEGAGTGAALVVDESFEHTLLTHHTKLDRWFQFGGHSDGENNTFNVALREAHEESGLAKLSFDYRYPGIFDLDVHPIPANEKLEAHDHYDVRMLLVANKSEEYTVNYESKDLKWVPLNNVSEYNKQYAFLRLVKKVQNLKA